MREKLLLALTFLPLLIAVAVVGYIYYLYFYTKGKSVESVVEGSAEAGKVGETEDGDGGGGTIKGKEREGGTEEDGLGTQTPGGEEDDEEKELVGGGDNDGEESVDEEDEPFYEFTPPPPPSPPPSPSLYYGRDNVRTMNE